MTNDKESPHARWQTLPLDAVSLTDGFWFQWQNTNRKITLQHGFRMLEKAGNFNNFRIAAGLKQGHHQGRIFNDSDVYKWLEAVGYELHIHPNSEIQRQANYVIDLVASAQQADGYLNTYYQIVEPGKRWTDLDFGHELYCAGHLFQAAAAYTRATNTTKLLEIATRLADLLGATFGPGKRQGTSGHPEVELALVELYRVTGKSAYLDLAKYFVDQRGTGVMRGMGWLGAEYHQDRVPVREAYEVEGHAVRAMYLNAGVADLYLETGEGALFTALERLWNDMTDTKLYITGGLGARYEGESFGAPYELPSDQCYCETCAAIGSILWNWRMLLITGESHYIDLLERTLYNGVISGLALDGNKFFYINPLLSHGGIARQAWYEVACCPPNLMRTLASIGQYFVTYNEQGLQIHLYNTGVVHAELPSGQVIGLSMDTDYPWHGRFRVTIDETDDSTWQLRLRIPEWSCETSVAHNGQLIDNPQIESGYVVLEHAWRMGDFIDLEMSIDPFIVEANPRVDAVRGSVAIHRGPLVYCLEATDNPGINLLDVQLDESAPLRSSWQEDMLAGGVMAVKVAGFTRKDDEWQGHLYHRVRLVQSSLQPVMLTAIPYYVWANRSADAMRVWLPRAEIG